MLEANVILNDMSGDVTVSNLAVGNEVDMDIVINVPLEGTLGTARFEKIRFDVAEDANNEW